MASRPDGGQLEEPESAGDLTFRAPLEMGVPEVELNLALQKS